MRGKSRSLSELKEEQALGYNNGIRRIVVKFGGKSLAKAERAVVLYSIVELLALFLICLYKALLAIIPESNKSFNL